MPKPTIFSVLFKSFEFGIDRKSMNDFSCKLGSNEVIKCPHISSISGRIGLIIGSVQDSETGQKIKHHLNVAANNPTIEEGHLSKSIFVLFKIFYLTTEMG